MARHDDDLIPDDDAVIGRAFRRSLLVLVVAAALAGAAWWWLARPEAAPPVLEKSLGQVADLPAPAPEAPVIPFTEITQAAGITFRHVNGARGAKFLPETMGSGAAFVDYDGDGHQDLLLVNSRRWPGASPQAGEPVTPTQALYRNDGSGSFTDVTAATGLDLEMYGMGVAVGDYDGDGDRDIYLTALGANRLLYNDDGRFRDVTAVAGVAGSEDAWSTSAGFFDADNDGDLDLFVCNYVRWTPEIDEGINFTLNGRDRAYGPPTDYQGAHSYLFRNDGDGTFTDVSQEAGIQVSNPETGLPAAKALAVTFSDLDGDGFLDILVASDTTQNLVFHNRKDGTFQEIGALTGLGFDSDGRATGAMGIDAAHYGNDDRLAVAIGNFANEMTSFFVNWEGESLRFSDEAAGSGIGSPSRLVLSFGLFFFDADLDGGLDLLQANGHIEEAIAEVQGSQTYLQPAQIFWNAGPEALLAYVALPAASTGNLARPLAGRAATYADIDGDGDLDVLLTQPGGRPLLLRNDQTLGGHWIRLALTGGGGNRDAIGAQVAVFAGGRVQRQQVMPTRSYLAQVELPLTFGLGEDSEVERLEIRWPDGTVQEVDMTGQGVDRLISITRSE